MAQQYGGSQMPDYGGQYQPPPQQPPPQFKGFGQEKRGCGPTGCIVGCLVMLIVLVLLAAGGSWYIYSWAKKNLLEDKPIAIEKTVLTPQQQAALAQKLAPIKKALDNDTGEEFNLTLTENEVNWLLANSPKDIPAEMPEGEPGEAEAHPESEPGSEAQTQPGHVRVTFYEKGRLRLKASFPFDPTKPSSQFVNIEADGGLAITNGQITITMTKARVGKVEVGESTFKDLNKEISKNIQDNPDLLWVWDRVRELHIEEGRVELKLRALKPPQTRHSSYSDDDD